MYDNKQKIFGSSMLILCAVIWGLAFAFQRTASGIIGPIAFNGLRFMFATAVIFVVILIKEPVQKKLGVRSRGWTKSTIVGGIICGVCILLASNLIQYSISYISAGKASFINALYIIWVPIIGLVSLKKPEGLSGLAVPIALAGFCLMCGDGGTGFGKGDLIGFVSTVFFALHIVFIDIFVKDADPLKLTFVQFLVCSIISIPAMAIEGFPSPESIKGSIIALVYVGICSTGIGYTMQTLGQRWTEPTIASLFMSLESVVGLIGGVIILNEQHSAMELGGCVLVFVAVGLANLSFPRKLLEFDKRRFDIKNRSAIKTVKQP